jgi:hypothetical protein
LKPLVALLVIRALTLCVYMYICIKEEEEGGGGEEEEEEEEEEG